jgi:hypothetical protein
VISPQNSQSFQPIHSGHLHIEQYDSGSASVAQALQSLFSVAGDVNLITIKFQQEAHVVLEFERVFDYQDRSFRRVKSCSWHHWITIDSPTYPAPCGTSSDRLPDAGSLPDTIVTPAH